LFLFGNFLNYKSGPNFDLHTFSIIKSLIFDKKWIGLHFWAIFLQTHPVTLAWHPSARKLLFIDSVEIQGDLDGHPLA
jgi:hypothetical protein